MIGRLINTVVVRLILKIIACMCCFALVSCGYPSDVDPSVTDSDAIGSQTSDSEYTSSDDSYAVSDTLFGVVSDTELVEDSMTEETESYIETDSLSEEESISMSETVTFPKLPDNTDETDSEYETDPWDGSDTGEDNSEDWEVPFYPPM